MSFEQHTLYWNISLIGIAVGMLLVALRITAKFNSETQKITWKWGIAIPIFSFRAVAFKEVAFILKSSKGVMEHMQIGGQLSAAQVSNTYYRIYVVLKKSNRKISLINTDKSEKVDAYCEKIATVLSFKELSSGSGDNRRWGRYMQ